MLHTNQCVSYLYGQFVSFQRLMFLWSWSVCTHTSYFTLSHVNLFPVISLFIHKSMKSAAESSWTQTWILFRVPAVHLKKADFALACLEVSIALKYSNPSSTFSQPFLTHSRVTTKCTGWMGHTCAYWVYITNTVKLPVKGVNVHVKLPAHVKASGTKQTFSKVGTFLRHC